MELKRKLFNKTDDKKICEMINKNETKLRKYSILQKLNE
jgi:hypothetical protein